MDMDGLEMGWGWGWGLVSGGVEMEMGGPVTGSGEVVKLWRPRTAHSPPRATLPRKKGHWKQQTRRNGVGPPSLPVPYRPNVPLLGQVTYRCNLPGDGSRAPPRREIRNDEQLSAPRGTFRYPLPGNKTLPG